MIDRLQAQIESTVAGLGYELLGIERGRANGELLLRLYIDQDAGITVEDCERVSRQVSDLIDADELVRGEYTLEVSSPGIERPLFTLDQHARFIGERVQVRLRTLVEGRRRVIGVLRAVSEDALVIELEEGDVVDVPFRDVERSRLAPDWSQQKAKPRGRRGTVD